MDDALAIPFFSVLCSLILWFNFTLAEMRTAYVSVWYFGVLPSPRLIIFWAAANPGKCYKILQSVIHSSIYCTQFWIFPKTTAVNGGRSVYLSWHKWSFDIDASNFVSLIIRLFFSLFLSHSHKLSLTRSLLIIHFLLLDFRQNPLGKLMSVWCCKFHSRHGFFLLLCPTFA